MTDFIAWWADHWPLIPFIVPFVVNEVYSLLDRLSVWRMMRR